MDREDLKLGAFMCYARKNDRDGTLTKLREKLSEEVEEVIGEEFPIFQDIEWGEDSKERIDESLSEVTFFIPIITPNFFKSDYCRYEFNRFLDREKKLGRNDLVLPIYYIEARLLETEAERTITDRDGDSERDIKTLAKIINDRQRPNCADWRKLRTKCRNSFSSEEVYKALEGLAIQIRDALDRLSPMGREPSVVEHLKPKNTQPPKTQPLKKASRLKPYRTEIVVDQMNLGDYDTISEAILAASPGDKILVRPGLYQEGLVIDKPLEIIGEGERDEIEIQAMGTSALVFRTSYGRVANLTLRLIGGGNWYSVDIAQGKLKLEDCDISSQGSACVAIHDFANPHIRRNKIHDGKLWGVFIYQDGQGIIEENDIFGNAYPGVGIETGANPTLRHNKIHDGDAHGVFVYQNGQGIIEENDIFSNAASGVDIMEGGNPILRRNNINNNDFEAVRIFSGGGGVIKNNNLSDNKRGAWDISEDSEPYVQRSGNLE